MEGIKVLSTSLAYDSGLIIGIIFMVVTSIICLIIVILELLFNRCFSDTSVGFLAGLIVFSICTFLMYNEYKNSYYTEQKLLIDESVSMTEFNKHYELLRMDGDIYIVKVLDEEDKK